MKDINCRHFDSVVRQRLEASTTPEQMLNVLIEEYDLDCPMSPLVKIAFIAGLRTAVKMIQPDINVNL